MSTRIHNECYDDNLVRTPQRMSGLETVANKGTVCTNTSCEKINSVDVQNVTVPSDTKFTNYHQPEKQENYFSVQNVHVNSHRHGL